MITLRKNILKALSEQYPFELKTPWNDLPEEITHFILHGNPEKEFELKLQAGRGKAKKQVFPGVFQDLQNTMWNTSSETLRAKLLTCQFGTQCPDCQGGRLSSYVRNVKVAGSSIDTFLALPVEKAWKFIKTKAAKDQRCIQVEDALHGLMQRLGFIEQVGLGYLTLDRSYRSLSGGEAQRARLATQLGMGLVGVTYALDEPSVGLHPADHGRLLKVLEGLRDKGNTVIVVEHDLETIAEADYVVDLGPGGGTNGGNIVAMGTIKDVMKCSQSKIGQYLKGKWSLPEF